MNAPTMPTPKKRAPTKAELQRVLARIERRVTRAEEIIAMDRHRPMGDDCVSPNWYSLDFGILQANIEMMREALDALRDRL